jgi:cysteine rich repeat protein
MIIRAFIMSAAILCACSMALAESGSPQQRDACRPDVRRFCHKLQMTEGDNAFVECLKANLAKLSKECRAALESNGK